MKQAESLVAIAKTFKPILFRLQSQALTAVQQLSVQIRSQPFDGILRNWKRSKLKLPFNEFIDEYIEEIEAGEL